MGDSMRRCRIDQLTPAEEAIVKAVAAVEELPADVRLTDAVYHLTNARNSVADFVDNEPRREQPETGWLIEIPGPHWWNGSLSTGENGKRYWGWTAFAHSAIRFAREADAKAAVSALRIEHDGLTVTQHVFA